MQVIKPEEAHFVWASLVFVILFVVPLSVPANIDGVSPVGVSPKVKPTPFKGLHANINERRKHTIDV